MPNVVSVMPAYEHETPWMKQVASDCLWSDPASEAMEPKLPSSGFGDSPRGGGAVCFGAAAVDNFLNANNLSYIIRAHEAHSHGVSLSKGARYTLIIYTYTMYIQLVCNLSYVLCLHKIYYSVYDLKRYMTSYT